MPETSLEDLKAQVGTFAGLSAWFAITQKNVNAFADVTADHQFIHVDEELAKQTPLGGTIAHGFYTLSLIAGMAEDAVLMLKDMKMGLNYGLNSVRFLSPVRVGKRVRTRFALTDLKERGDGGIQTIYHVTVEIEGEDKPALVADWITLQYL